MSRYSKASPPRRTTSVMRKACRSDLLSQSVAPHKPSPAADDSRPTTYAPSLSSTFKPSSPAARDLKFKAEGSKRQTSPDVSNSTGEVAADSAGAEPFR